MQNEYAIPDDHSLGELTSELFSYLSSTDPELRDDIGYIVYANWLRMGLYSKADITDHIATLLTNLETDIGKTESDGVFLRSFSALFLAEIVHNNNKSPQLDNSTIHTLLDKALWYLAAEIDVRGRVSREKGWAHSAAHTADLLNVLARNPHTNKDNLQRILNAIANKILSTRHQVYCYDEDERLVSAVISILDRDLLDLAFITDWLNTLAHPGWLSSWKEMFRDEETCFAHMNTKIFLRSLHFRLLISESPPAISHKLLPVLVDAIRTITAWY